MANSNGKSSSYVSRRKVLKAGAAGAAVLASPAILRRAYAADPIKIGIPTDITGGYAVLGSHVLRTCKLIEKEVAQKGGPLGRPVKFVYTDTQGKPQNCVRKVQEFVERDKINLFTGVINSSEARAIMPKLAEWDAFFISHGNGDGRLTAELLVPNFFRANTSAPMGARTLALFLRDAKAKSFYAIGSDYAWGHSSVGAFEQQIQRVGKKFAGKVFAPVGNKDYSTYITKIRKSGAEGVYVALQGDEGRAFYSQATQYGLAKRIQMVTEIVAQANIDASGKDSIGLVGSSRYAWTSDIPQNKAFLKQFLAAYKKVPDWSDGEIYQACQVIFAAINKAGSTKTADVVKATEDLKITSVKGPLRMRKCDHQGEQQGFVVQVVADKRYSHPIPKLIKTYPAERVTPPCNKSSYND